MATTTGLVRPLERVVGFYYGFLLSWQVCLSKDWPVKWMGSGAVVFTQECKVHTVILEQGTSGRFQRVKADCISLIT